VSLFWIMLTQIPGLNIGYTKDMRNYSNENLSVSLHSARRFAPIGGGMKLDDYLGYYDHDPGDKCPNCNIEGNAYGSDPKRRGYPCPECSGVGRLYLNETEKKAHKKIHNR